MESQDKYFNFARHVFAINQHRDNKVAFIDNADSITYGALEQQARHFSANLAKLGVRRGDRVMLAMKDSIDLPVAILGSILGGYVFVPCNPRTTTSTLRKYFDISSPTVVIADVSVYDTVVSWANSCSHRPCFVIASDRVKKYYADSDCKEPSMTARDSEAYWFFTSGGSGEPKAVVHAHGAMYVQGSGVAGAYGITSDDIIYNTSKMFWNYGFNYNFCATLLAGAASVLREKLPTPTNVVDTIRRCRPTIVASIPRIYSWILDSDLDIADLSPRFYCSGGELLPVPIINQWKKVTGTVLYDIYGNTESAGVVFTGREGVRKIGTLGKAIPGYEVEIRDAEGAVCQPGEVGELYVKTPAMAIWYHDDLERTRKSFFGEWFRTNDRFVQDHDGFFRFVGRVNDMFRVNSAWVSPVEIENVLAENQLIHEVGVTSQEDEHGLAQVCAFVVLKPDVSVPANFDYELKKLVKRRLEPFKSPKTIKIVSELPRNENGKIQRFLLRGL